MRGTEEGGRRDGEGDAPIVMERTVERVGGREGGRALAINFGREECGAHVRPGYILDERMRRGTWPKLRLNARQTIPSCALLRDSSKVTECHSADVRFQRISR